MPGRKPASISRTAASVDPGPAAAGRITLRDLATQPTEVKDTIDTDEDVGVRDQLAP